jgi:predicted DNA-binding mobile mystery protein A
MKPSAELRKLRLRQIDTKLREFRSTAPSKPREGWIATVRKALGMSTTQLGKRLGIAQPSVIDLEKGERARTVSLESLHQAADALNCDLVYALVPRTSLEDTLEQQAMSVAKRKMSRVTHTMSLENQTPPSEETEAQIRDLSARLLVELPRDLWNT